MTHTDEYWRQVRRANELLATCTLDDQDRLFCVVRALKESLSSPTMLEAGQVLFEDYASIRLCVRAMMTVLIRRLR